mgnify:CR=1 FL=1
MGKVGSKFFPKEGLYVVKQEVQAEPIQSDISLEDLIILKDRKIAQLEKLLDLKTQELWKLRNEKAYLGQFYDYDQDLRPNPLSRPDSQIQYDLIGNTKSSGNFMLRLKTRFPSLSANDLRICTLLKHNLSTKEVAHHLGIGADSANKARYRIRKKLRLDRSDDLVYFLLQF